MPPIHRKDKIIPTFLTKPNFTSKNNALVVGNDNVRKNEKEKKLLLCAGHRPVKEAEQFSFIIDKFMLTNLHDIDTFG